MDGHGGSSVLLIKIETIDSRQPGAVRIGIRERYA